MAFQHRRAAIKIPQQLSKFPDSFPCAARDECGLKLQDWCGANGIPKCVRSDNAKEFKDPLSGWREICGELKIKPFFSPPYHPQMNGLVEMLNRSLLGGLRATMAFVDPLLWCYAACFVAYVWGRTARRDGSVPYTTLTKRTAKKKHWRRFGCLCFQKTHTQIRKLEHRYVPSVFLGY